jgi:hypothetical protein
MTKERRPMKKIRNARLAGIGLAGLAASLVLAAPASAGPCGGPLSQPFAPWGDASSYLLAPGGDFESTAAWFVTGNATLVAGSEPFKATGRAGRYSLSLPEGSTALSPMICLTIDHPTFRYFSKSAQGDAASLRVEGLAEGANEVVPLGTVGGTTEWSPSPVLSTGASSLLLGKKGAVQVRLRFTADHGDSQIDDVFVDPRKMG